MKNPQLASYSIGKNKSISFNIRTKTDMSTLTFLIQHSPGSLSPCKQEEIKGIQTEKKEIELSLFATSMIVYTENSKDYTKKTTKLINEFNKIAVYKINIEKLIAFIYQ